MRVGRVASTRRRRSCACRASYSLSLLVSVSPSSPEGRLNRSRQFRPVRQRNPRPLHPQRPHVRPSAPRAAPAGVQPEIRVSGPLVLELPNAKDLRPQPVPDRIQQILQRPVARNLPPSPRPTPECAAGRSGTSRQSPETASQPPASRLSHSPPRYPATAAGASSPHPPPTPRRSQHPFVPNHSVIPIRSQIVYTSRVSLATQIPNALRLLRPAAAPPSPLAQSDPVGVLDDPVAVHAEPVEPPLPLPAAPSPLASHRASLTPASPPPAATSVRCSPCVPGELVDPHPAHPRTPTEPPLRFVNHPVQPPAPKHRPHPSPPASKPRQNTPRRTSRVF